MHQLPSTLASYRTRLLSAAYVVFVCRHLSSFREESGCVREFDSCQVEICCSTLPDNHVAPWASKSRNKSYEMNKK